MPRIRSAYIVQSCVISIGNKPLDKEENYRSSFYPIFSSKTCFKDLMESNEKMWNDFNITRLSSEPFIRNLGQVCFNTRSVNLNPFPEDLVDLLTDEYSDDLAEHKDLKYFGYDKSLEDQRMNVLYFELLHPIFLKATLDGETRADGNIFLHFYPCGFIILHLAVSFKANCLENVEELRKSVEETRPWRKNNKWIWTCKFGQNSLYDIMEYVKSQLSISVYTNKFISDDKCKWHSTLKIGTREKAGKIVSQFLKGDYERFNIDDDEYIFSSHQGVIYLFPFNALKTSVLHSFWKKFSLIEFIMLKQAIYQSYIDHLSSEILSLKNFRQDTIRKLTKEDFIRFSIYDSNIPTFLQALDRHILNSYPFYRRIYVSISLGKGFDEQRKKVLELAKEWEIEVGQWEPSAVVLWKKIISPIRSLLK